MSELSDLAHRVSSKTREQTEDAIKRAVVLTTLISVTVQTVILSIVIVFLFQHFEDVARRQDRNLAYTVCILGTPPATRANDDYFRCLKETNQMYPDVEPPLPSPAFTTEGEKP